MIYISSACSPEKKIDNAIEDLAGNGFRHIELTGGTFYFPGYESRLFELKKKYKLDFLIHNYFPPPEDPFILNLASLKSDIYAKSMAHLRKALELTRRMGGDRFGFHAGFLVDRPVSEIGKQFGKSDLYNRKKAGDQFVKGFLDLKAEFGDIALYLENNVYSSSNGKIYGISEPPFMLLRLEDYLMLKQQIDFKLLLDVGHLMVSANTLGVDFDKEFNQMFELSDYIHISSNDRLHDQNLGLTRDSQLFESLNKCCWEGKTVTLEIYEGMDALRRSYSILSGLTNRRQL